MVHSVSVVDAEDITYLFLPLAHSFALLIQLGSFDLGASIAYWERDPLKILPNLAEVKPDLLPVGAADLREDLHGGDVRDREGGRAEEDRLRARDRGRAQGPGARAGGQAPEPDPRDRVQARRQAGAVEDPRRCSAAACGPRSPARRRSTPRSSRSSTAAGVLVLEGWGMTETSTASTISTPDDFKVGTVGRPFPGCEVKIADDGEILVKGPNIFQGYYKNPEATAETLVDGWLHTGDIGEIDSDGYVSITGRKKDIIITAGWQEHHPGEPRGRDQAAPARLAVRRHRRPPSVPDRARDTRPRGGRRLRARPRPRRLAGGARRQQGHPRLDRDPRREDQPEVRPRRAGQEDRDPHRTTSRRRAAS